MLKPKIGDLVSLGNSYFGMVTGEQPYNWSYTVLWFKYDNCPDWRAENTYEKIAVERWRRDFLRKHGASGTM
jgi:hypothetical protein